MRYLHVTWLHELPEEPIELYSELDDESWEIRKVEFFRDGTAGFASATKSAGTTRLGEVRVPSIDSIAEDLEFRPVEISATVFEQVWQSARSLIQSR